METNSESHQAPSGGDADHVSGSEDEEAALDCPHLLEGESDDGTLPGNGNSAEHKNSVGEIVNEQLEEFRQQWHQELQQNPVSGSSSPCGVYGAETKDTQVENPVEPVDVESQARSYFFQGMEAEDDGLLSEAIYYYRKALQLVPDIESRLGQVFNQSPRERVREDSESSMDGSEFEEDLVTHIDSLNLKDNALCQPQFEQRMAHISALPIELITYILQWVVSSDLDVRSLEMFSMVCRGFFLCARDERIWKMTCQKIWGVNLGSAKKFGGSWRRMMIERLHLLFDGCYISRVSYVRQGEQGLDNFYRPFHLVEYYRYIRFFPDGQILMLVSPEEPQVSLAKLKYRTSRSAGMLRGGYRLSDNKVTLVLKRVKSENLGYKYRRHRQAANQNEAKLSYLVEFNVIPAGKRPNAQLAWISYATRSVNRATGEETVSSFDLNKKSFPSLIFSRVRSFSSCSTEPLV